MSPFKTKERRFNVVKKKTKRPLHFVGLGVFLLGLAGFLVYDHLQVQSAITPDPEPYKYSVQQGVDIRTQYRENSFFSTMPDASNTAYLTDLTESINAQFNYKFAANEASDLTYQYQATALIRALYGNDKSSEGGMANVWSKQYTLVEPVKENLNSPSLTLNPVVQIPFADYYRDMEQFRNAYSAPINSELAVTYTVTLTGNVRGTPISDSKRSVVTVPLDQQIFKVSTQFEKSSNKEIVPTGKKGLSDTIAKFELPLAATLVVLAVAAIIYGLREQMIKSPYQRKLEKIYRYHDGIIVRTKQPPDLRHKNIVTITSFDDMLNLEEELKTPIIASKVSDYTTHFFITQDDIAYVFTLGIPIPFKDSLGTSHADDNQQ